jgi:purine-binding chemotaxis protein CheW
MSAAPVLNSPRQAAPVAAANHRADAGPSVSLLRMSVGSEVLSLPIDEVHEILQVTRMTPLPRTPAFVRGVMNLRGAVVPVIDLAARLGQPATVLGRRSCIVVVSCGSSHEATDTEGGEDADGSTEAPGDAPLTVGLLVDAVFEVFDRGSHEIEPAPALGTRVATDYLRGITRAAGALVGVLSLARVLAARELTEAIAAYRPAH